MHIIKRNIYVFAALLLCFLFMTGSAEAQNLSFNYYSTFEMMNVTEPPKISGMPDVKYPDEARRNGVEGTVKAAMTLGENGRVRDVVITQGLPHGVSEAVTKALQELHFQPAKRNGEPVAVKMFFDFVVSVGYDEGDKNVSKPKIVEKPAPIYPEKYRAEKLKGKVMVAVMFFADGTMKISNVSSVMPKEFDQAAREAAAKIKFEPAVHKKSKKAVGQAMTVEYEFKP